MPASWCKPAVCRHGACGNGSRRRTCRLLALPRRPAAPPARLPCLPAGPAPTLPRGPCARLQTEEFHEAWKLKARDVMARAEWRRRKLTKRVRDRLPGRPPGQGGNRALLGSACVLGVSEDAGTARQRLRLCTSGAAERACSPLPAPPGCAADRGGGGAGQGGVQGGAGGEQRLLFRRWLAGARGVRSSWRTIAEQRCATGGGAGGDGVGRQRGRGGEGRGL